MAPTVNLTDTDVDDHFQASRKSRLERGAAAGPEKDDSIRDARLRSRSKPREKTDKASAALPPCPAGFVRPTPMIEDAPETGAIETTPKRPRHAENNEKTPPPVSRRNMIKAAAVEEEEAEGADRTSGANRKDKETAGNFNKALKDLALQLEARLRIQEGATSNTVRLKSDHPLIDKMKEIGEMYNKTVQNNQGHTMGPPHFHYMLGLLDWLAGEITEKEKNDENKDKPETKFLTSLREAVARQAATADVMQDWELDMLFRSCRVAADFQNQKKKTDATSRISYAIAGSVLVDNTPMENGEKFHSHPLVAKAAPDDSKVARIELQFVLVLLLAEHGATVLAGPAPRGSKARQLLDKDKKRR